MPKTRTIVEISPKTILVVVAVLLALSFLFYIREILVLLLVAIMFSTAIDQPVDWLHRKGVPRSLSMVFIYLLVIAAFSLTAALIIPPLASQATSFFAAIPTLFEKVGILINSAGFNFEVSKITNFQSVLETLGSSVFGSGGSLFSTISGIFGGFFSGIFVLVLTFYLVVQENGLKNFIRSLAPTKNQPYITNLTNRIQTKIGLWLRGQIMLALIIFVLTYIALLLIDVPYALILAVAAGLLEIVPFLGPVIAAIPAILFVLDDPVKILFVVLAYIVINQLENHLIVPNVMHKAVGLNPVIIIISLLIGAKLAGVIGIIMALPVATAVAEFAGDLFRNKTELTREKAKPAEM